AELHGEAADGGAARQRDAELAFDDAVLRVLEGERELRERERIFDDGAGVVGDEIEAGAGGRGQADGRLGAEGGESDEGNGDREQRAHAFSERPGSLSGSVNRSV